MEKLDECQSDDPADTSDVDLPEGWCRTKLADVGMLTTGNTPSRSNERNFGNIYPWVKPPDLHRTEPITSTAEGLSKEGASVARLLPPGTVMLSCIGNLGKVGITGTTLATNQQINSVTFYDSLVLPRYGFHYCKTLRPWLEDQASATTIPIVNKGKLSIAPFLLAPQAEQLRIAQMIDILLEQLNQARDHLSRVPAILKRFRQAVLAAACSGKLTEDWRQLHAEEDSVASLRQSIATKRARAWESAQSAKHRKRRYPEPAPLDEAELPEIPETWTWVSADEVCSQITDGEHIQPRYQAAGLPMITATHVRDGFVEFTDVGLISEEDFQRCLERCAPAKNDVLIVSVGATTGRAAIVPECQPFAMVRSVLLLRPLMEPKFLLRWVQSRWSQTWISQASGASAQPHFYIHDNKRMPVPLPPTSEQAEIVRRVDALFALADTIEGHARAAIFRADKLTQSVLAKAFRGELVPTEAELARREGREYEPASVLLERIKKERESRTSSKPERKMRKASAHV